MHEHIGVSSDWRRKVSVLCHRQTIVADLAYIYCRHAEVHSLIHTPRGHDPNQLVKVRVILVDCSIERLCQFLRGVSSNFEALLL